MEQERIRAEAQKKIMEEKRKADEEARKKAQELRAKAEKEADESKRKEILAKAQEEDLKPMQAPDVEEVRKTSKSENATASLRKVWKWELIDMEKAMKAHPELFSINSVEVNKLMRAGTRELDGFRFYEDADLSVR